MPGVLAAVALVVTGCSSGHHRELGRSAAGRTGPARTAGSPGGVGAASPSPGAAGSLQWTDCDGPFQCARLDVPLDHLRPDGRTLHLALERAPATDPGHRVGSLLVNPGGPGASTLEEFTSLVELLSPQLRAHFDIVGFDPRGVGASSPVRCVGYRTAPVHGDPTTAAGLTGLLADDRAYAAACSRGSGTLLRYVGTDQAARDMDDIRAAVGDPKLTYVGFSYGTSLGATYARLFPTRVRALVLDGAVDPALPPLAYATAQSEALQRSLDAFLGFCRRQSTCTWHPGPDPAGALHRLVRRVAVHPLPNVLDKRRVGPSVVGAAILPALYDPRTWTGLGEALHEAEQGDGTALLVLADQYDDRRTDGTGSNLEGAGRAITCADQPALPSATAVLHAAAVAERAAPDFGRDDVLHLLACTVWPVRPARAVGAPSVAGLPPVLVVGSTGDPATPYSEAQALARELPHGVLLTRVGAGHTAYRFSACIRARADAYLLTLAVPARTARTCPS